MRITAFALVCLILFAAVPAAAQESKTVEFKAADGTTIVADVYVSSKGKKAPVILLFHQGGADVRGEYERILPRLTDKGFNVIAADLRVGGAVFEGTNRTRAKFAEPETDYCAAYPDLEATLKYAREQGFGGKTIAWGSSYSAALVIKLAAEHQGKVDAVLSFSPASGGPMENCSPSMYLSKVKVPLLALRPGSEMQRVTSKAQFEELRNAGHKTYIAENGVHGSSMLDPERVEGDVSAHWKAVEGFLSKVLEN
ncbi:MAG: alpha/beta fold hydrolase [Acidobacteriota bacterium]|nr:MAG: alpha/beta fold hydrolase [Acidobacteriota bacterium]